MPFFNNRTSIVAMTVTGLLTFTGHNAALAQSSAMELSFDPKLPRYAVQQMARNPEQFLRNQISQLYRIDTSGIVTKEKYAEYQVYRKLKQRGRVLGGYLFMDINGDFEISSSEAATSLKFEPNSMKSRYTLLLLNGDKDNDGNISRAELIEYVNAFEDKRRRRPVNGIDVFVFDMNNDGTVTPSELKAYVDANTRK